MTKTDNALKKKPKTLQKKTAKPKTISMVKPETVKRPKTSWIHFITSKYNEAKKKGNPPPFKSFWIELSPQWKQMSAEEKMPYTEIYRQERQNYKNEMENMPKETRLEILRYKKWCKKKKSKSNPDKPKQAMTAFLVFSQRERPKIKQEFPEMKFGDIGKELGKRWKEADTYTKSDCTIISENDKKRYQQELAVFKTTEQNKKKDVSKDLPDEKLPQTPV